MDVMLDTGGFVTVPPELVRSSKALFDEFYPRADVAWVTLDAVIAGEPRRRDSFRRLSFDLPDGSLTIRLEQASACGVLRVTCTPVVAGVLTVRQAGGRPIRQELIDGTATVDGVAPTWTSVVIHSDHRSGDPVRTAWALL